MGGVVTDGGPFFQQLVFEQSEGNAVTDVELVHLALHQVSHPVVQEPVVVPASMLHALYVCKFGKLLIH